ncbi:cytochrome P450 [Lasiosphaeris hirsuta]|uniref:Cytochrome P450 n=1 Tax=Lasiosphaeris hirsuta TaxID=260670 RepID=A0AA40BAM4_9PEZI|nr:cytochrome P450 [Lasiosphaeris hirsuta]
MASLSLPRIFVSCLVSSFVFILTRRYWRLKGINGPLLAAFTDLWRARIQYFGPFVPTLLKLHEKYGAIVRIGPNTVSFSDPAYIGVVGSARGGFAKADSYGAMRGFVNGKSVGSIIDMQDEEKHRAIKRAVGNAFITKSMLDYQGDVDVVLDALLRNIRTHRLGSPFDLNDLMQLFQLDFLLKIAFGENSGHLDSDRDVSGMAKVLYKRIMHWYAWQPLPNLERFIFQNPLWSRFFVQPSKWARAGAMRVEARREQIKQGLVASEGPRDLLQKYLDASEKHPDIVRPEIISWLVNSTISAGADTTSGTLTTALYLLLKHPRVHAKLLRELCEARDAGRLSFPIRYAMVEHLPYLDAVIKEAMRLNAPLAVPLERVVPLQGCFLGDVYLPGRTVVACAPYVIHQNKECFGEDVAEFRPERYLEKKGADLLAMEKANLAFGLGSRICIGRHIADLEMKIVLPSLLMMFDFKLVNPDFDVPFDLGIFEMELNPITVTVSERVFHGK